MKHSWTTISVTALLIGLVTFFAVSQYFMLRQNAETDREKMSQRVTADSIRMSEELDRMPQSLLGVMHNTSDVRIEEFRQEFVKNYLSWEQGTEFPEIVKDFYFVPKEPEPAVNALKYNKGTQMFDQIDLTDELKTYAEFFSSGEFGNQVWAKEFVLAIKARKRSFVEVELFESMARTVVTRPLNTRTPYLPTTSDEHIGDLYIVLDRDALARKIIPTVFERFFPEKDFAFEIISKEGSSEFISSNDKLTAPDAEAGFFDIKSNNLVFIAVNGQPLSVGNVSRTGGSTDLIRAVRSESLSASDPAKTQVRELRVFEGKETRVASVSSTPQFKVSGRSETSALTVSNTTPSFWSLRVQHRSGSIGDFIDREMNKQLLLGMTVYILLVGSIIAIVWSALRSKQFAQRQVDFVSSVSHEFRTPLSVIYSAGENLADGVAKTPEQIGQYGNLVRGEGKKLSRMVEQILEFAGARNGKRSFYFSETPIEKIIDDAVAECVPHINEKGFDLKIDVQRGGGSIKADSEALSGAIQNLITNAIKYSNGNKNITLKTEIDGGKLFISVTDKGIGIKPKDLKHIFEPFYRSKEVVDAQIHGNGLGLALVKDVVKAHKGTVTANSKYGEGSTFTIELPV